MIGPHTSSGTPSEVSQPRPMRGLCSRWRCSSRGPCLQLRTGTLLSTIDNRYGHASFLPPQFRLSVVGCNRRDSHHCLCNRIPSACAAVPWAKHPGLASRTAQSPRMRLVLGPGNFPPDREAHHPFSTTCARSSSPRSVPPSGRVTVRLKKPPASSRRE
jgi:hypothetical protein